MRVMAARGNHRPCHPGWDQSGGDGVTAGSGQPWWSDALNDPWRDPDSDMIVRSTAPAPEPPPPAFEVPPPTATRAASRLIVTVAVAVGLMAGALGGAVGYVAAVSRERPTTIGGGSHGMPPVSRPSGSIPAVVADVMPSVVTVSGTTAHGGTLGSGFV